jgi:hypothetical protein
MVIAVDFDGTCVTHEYPKIGKDIGSVPVLKELVENGHQLILYTMRCDSGVKKGKFTSGLTDAINWFKENDIPLYGIQYNPTQKDWTQSNKCYAQLYIDDAALGCPLIFDENISKKPFVDWEAVKNILEDGMLIKSKIIEE